MSRNKQLVVDKLLTKPSAVSPMLFVGLGGCGCRIVSRVARHLRRRPDFDERYRELVKFALVDTNVNDLESYREIADETLLISDFEKEQYANLASGKLFLEEDPYFTQWIPQNYRFRAGDTAGAGQIRIESRLGLYYQMKHKDLVARFRKLLEGLKSHEHGHRRLDTSEIRIVLCYSIAGGTGSGSHLPLAYMLRDLARELGRAWLVGVAVLPAVFEDKTSVNKDGTFANGYAALKETEHLMRLGAPDSRFYPEDGIRFHYNPHDESRQVVRERPFEFVYVIDKPESFSVGEPVDAAADGLYLQFFSPLFGVQAGDYDNYTQHQRFLVPQDFEAKGILGFSSFYGSYGAAVLLVPVPGLLEYCSQAAALSLMRSNFLRDIPAGPAYVALRNLRETFDEVTLSDAKNERPVHRADFVKKESATRDRLRDRLFAKRVQLLAACELTEGQEGRFLALFRHGHRVGEAPRNQGGFEFRKERVPTDRQLLADRRTRYSINAIVLQALTGQRRGDQPGLLAQARRKMEAYADEEPYQQRGETTVANLKAQAAGWMDDFRHQGMTVLRDGYREGVLRFPGMDALLDLEFLKGEASEVDLAAKRYAVLRLIEEVDWDTRAPDGFGGFDAGDLDDGAKVREKDAQPLVDTLREQAIDQAMAAVKRQFVEQLGDLKVTLDRFAEVQRVLEQGFDELERDQSRWLERLREEGDSSANQYVLDAEALRMEDGRRLWDFFYEDRVATLPGLNLGNRQIQQVLTDTVTDLSFSGGGSTTTTLEKLFDALRRQAQAMIAPRIVGDPRATDRERREGLTLSDALELEVVYRALYLSDAKRVEQEGHRAIRDIVSEYRALPVDRKESLANPKHTDYLRDKIKRVVKEKASLLCVYDDSRDQHGGVRPDHVFLAAIDEDFKNSTIQEILRGADIPNLQWVSKGWSNPKEIIFYRAVLNVPLYVFGRVGEMRHHYYGFKNLARRSKVLHIDKGWEDSLPDLDPDSAMERHRQKLVRDQIINFATLLTLGRSDASSPDGHRHIVRRDGQFFLLDPNRPEDLETGGEDSATALGGTLAGAIEHLPDVLARERVKYLPYQQMLAAVRRGLAPRVLRGITQLPFQWRRNRDELRNQYGSNPELHQQEKLDDYRDAYQRLRESLDDLLERLRNHEIEQRTLGDDSNLPIADLPRRQAVDSLEESIEILKAFSETWQQMEDPAESRSIPRGFRDLFQPLGEEGLHQALDQLRQASSIGVRAPGRHRAKARAIAADLVAEVAVETPPGTAPETAIGSEG